MTSEQLIDKIEEIKAILADIGTEDPEDKRNIKSAIRVCEDVLLEWKIENARINKINEGR